MYQLTTTLQYVTDAKSMFTTDSEGQDAMAENVNRAVKLATVSDNNGAVVSDNVAVKKEEKKEGEDLSSPDVWLSYAKKYNYYCPTDDCWEPFYRATTMVSHMKRWVLNLEVALYYVNI